jgi:hypothetical protein
MHACSPGSAPAMRQSNSRDGRRIGIGCTIVSAAQGAQHRRGQACLVTSLQGASRANCDRAARAGTGSGDRDRPFQGGFPRPRRRSARGRWARGSLPATNSPDGSIAPSRIWRGGPGVTPRRDCLSASMARRRTRLRDGMCIPGPAPCHLRAKGVAAARSSVRCGLRMPGTSRSG